LRIPRFAVFAKKVGWHFSQFGTDEKDLPLQRLASRRGGNDAANLQPAKADKPTEPTRGDCAYPQRVFRLTIDSAYGSTAGLGSQHSTKTNSPFAFICDIGGQEELNKLGAYSCRLRECKIGPTF
jgi:hypothetical protein